nr:MAG TPA: hypothetical protein [Caudoviricetes sp.]
MSTRKERTAYFCVYKSPFCTLNFCLFCQIVKYHY